MVTWTAITTLGDINIMVPVATAITVWLGIGGARHQALWWVFLFTIGAVLVTLTKVAFVGWGIDIDILDFTGFSGHATFAAAVIPVAFYLVLQRVSPITRALGILAGNAIVLLICMSRLALHMHSPSEVIAGWFLGMGISICFMRIAQHCKKPILHNGFMAFGVAFLFLAGSYVDAAPTQRWIVDVALYLSGHDKPFSRNRQTFLVEKNEFSA